MSFEIEVLEVIWNEDTSCPRCKCRVLKEMYCLQHRIVDQSSLEDKEIIIIQCPNCDYDVTEEIEI